MVTVQEGADMCVHVCMRACVHVCVCVCVCVSGSAGHSARGADMLVCVYIRECCQHILYIVGVSGSATSTPYIGLTHLKMEKKDKQS